MPTDAPFPPEIVVLIDGRPVPAVPTKLQRKSNRAAVFDFKIPRRSFLHMISEDNLRQGSFVDVFYGPGTPQQRIFLGYLPALPSSRELAEGSGPVNMTAQDFVGLMQDYILTLGGTSSSYLNPIGYEIGAFLAEMAKQVFRAQTTDLSSATFTIEGFNGTASGAGSAQQFITESNVKLGTRTVKEWFDTYNGLAFDDGFYPQTPALYEYQQKGRHIVYRKQRRTSATASEAHTDLVLTAGKDAIIDGAFVRRPLVSDAIFTTTSGETFIHSDRDTSRRWGGRRFWVKGSSTSSFTDIAQADAVRAVEIGKSEHISLSVTVMREPFLLYPGDVVRLDNAEAFGARSALYRVAEVHVQFQPARTRIVFGDTERQLTDFLA